MKKILLEEHRGIGGIYFTMVNIICAFIMVIVLQLSWNSQAIAISDNLSYIVSINSTVNNYVSRTSSYTSTNPIIPTATGGSYDPLTDFNNMIKDAKLSSTGATTCVVTWTGTKTTVQMGKFKTIMGTYVTPHIQKSVIESS